MQGETIDKRELERMARELAKCVKTGSGLANVTLPASPTRAVVFYSDLLVRVDLKGTAHRTANLAV